MYTNEVKKGEIGKMFARRRLDVCVLSETKFEGTGVVMFGEVVGRVHTEKKIGVESTFALSLTGLLSHQGSNISRLKT